MNNKLILIISLIGFSITNAYAQRWPSMPENKSCYVIGTWRLVPLRNASSIEVYLGSYTSDPSTWQLVETTTTNNNGVLCLSNLLAIPDQTDLIVTDGTWKGRLYHPLKPIIWLEDDLVSYSDQFGSGDIAEISDCPSVALTDGFHAASGSNVRVFIDCGGAATTVAKHSDGLPLEEDKVPDKTTQKQLLRLYPNPATTQLNLQWSGDALPNQIRISNMQGATVFLKDWPQGQNDMQIGINRLPQGVFIIQVLQDDKKYYQKVIIR